MFDRIAGTYDLLNHLLSFGIDIYWRKRLLKEVSQFPHTRICEIATGTGDLLVAGSKKFPESQFLGIDLSKEMLEQAKIKLTAKKLQDQVILQCADAEALPIQEAEFDISMAAFGVRNFGNLSKGLSEMYRTLRPGGHICILEFSQPRYLLVKWVYNIYFHYILPLIGGWISGDRKAYHYLFHSVQSFPCGEAFCDHLRKIGFKSTQCIPLSFGIVSIYLGEK